MKRALWMMLALAGAIGLIAPAGAAVSQASQSNGAIISELRSGVLVHDLGRAKANKQREENTVDLNLELLFSPLWQSDTGNRHLDALLTPRLALGGMVNTAGYTNVVYGGIAWTFELFSNVFIEPQVGLAGHDGKLDARRAPDGRPSLGSPVVIRESLDLGYRLAERHQLSLFVSHISHAGWLAPENDSMNWAGVRYGLRFDRD